MANIEPFLLQLLRDKIEPSPSRIQRAIGSHNHLRARLNTGQFANRIEGSYLSGSYSRNTAIQPLDDVDVVILVNPGGWQVGVLERLFSATPKPSPEVILTSFANAVRARYDRSSVFMQRRSIRLKLAHLSLDVVPAVAASTPNLIWIPDRDKGEWIRSSPLLHKADGAEVNHRRAGLFKPLVKLLKYWNSGLPGTDRLKSFTIETMAARIFRAHHFSNIEDGFVRFLDFVIWRAGEPPTFQWLGACGISIGSSGLTVPDVARTGTNVAAGVNGVKAARFVHHARLTSKRLLEAQQAQCDAKAVSSLCKALRC